MPTTRRTALKAAVLGACSRATAQPPAARFDRFGGLTSVRFEPTGFFRVEKRDRWWFVTPDGHAWLGFGANHVHPGWLNQQYNATVWLKRFGAERFNDAAWKAGLAAKVKADMAACGFNHFGVHNDLAAVAGQGFPVLRTVVFVPIPHNRVAAPTDFPDVFDPAFARHCEAIAAKQVAPHGADPWTVGWAFTDCPIFTDAEAAARPVVTHGSPRDAAPTWPRVLRNLPGSAPGKRAWVETIRTRYADDLNAFNDCYGVSFATWAELLGVERWRELTDLANPRELADNRAFLERVVDRYYAAATAAVRRHAPRHLIFGDKLNANTDGGDAVLAATAKHIDVVFYQMYARWAAQKPVLDRWSKAAGKPLFNGDGTFSSPNPAMPNPHGPHARDQAERGEWTTEFGRHAFARPDFVGWTVCGWVDTWQVMPQKQFKQHSGFFAPDGEPHADYVRHLRRIADGLYDFARS